MKQITLHVSLLSLLVMLSPVVVNAGALTGGWTEGTQKANFVVWFLQNQQELQKFQALLYKGERLFEKLQDMQEQALVLSHFDNSQLADYINDLATIVQEGQAISFTSMASEYEFANQFTDYASYLSSSQNISTSAFAAIYKNWNDSLDATISNTIKANQLTYNDIANQEVRLQTILARTATATTRNQFLKASADIAAFTVQQIRRLSLIRMQHSQAHMQYLAYKHNHKALQSIKKQTYLTTGTLPILGDGAVW